MAKRPVLLDYPPVWLAGCLALAWVQAGLLPATLPARPWFALIGAALIAVGLALMVAAAWEMRRHRTTIVPHRDADALVTTGVFALSRNPIYLGDLLVLAGFCLRWGAWPSLVVLVPALAVVLRRRFIEPEEARLAARFGATFHSYKNAIRRWI
ncbi:MAG: isoprenylcysteine carboxylmethyltransferase family protein [Paracoccaceae bacterium]